MAAIEDIIGKYFAFDPFLQPGGRKGRDYYSEPDTIVNLKEDNPVLYSIPPTFTGSEDSFREQIPDYNESPPVYISNHFDNDAFNYKQFDNFQDEEFPQYSEFPANKHFKKNSFNQDSPISNLPKYVIGIHEDAADSIFTPQHDVPIRDPVYRGQLQQERKPLNPAIRKLPRFSNRPAPLRNQQELPTSRYNYYEDNMYYTTE